MRPSPFTLTIPVPHVLQIDRSDVQPRRCGAACVQMILQHVGAESDLPCIENGDRQQSIFMVTSHRPDGVDMGTWENYPVSMAECLNSSLGRVPYNYQVFSLAKHYDPSKRPNFRAQVGQVSNLIVENIKKGLAPIIAVRRNNSHWITVNGFTLNSSRDSTIKNLYIRNPLVVYARSDPDDSDSGCRIDHREDCVSYSTAWQQDYLQFYPNNRVWEARPSGSRKFPAEDIPRGSSFYILCDTDPGLWGIASRVVSSANTQQLPPQPVFNTLDLLAVGQKAQKEIIEQGLLQTSLWQRACPSPAKSLDPIMVVRLDDKQKNYFLIPIKSDSKSNTSMLISLTVNSLSFREATIWSEGDFVPFFSREKSIKVGLINREILNRSTGKMYKIKSVSTHPLGEFAWQPCLESFSTFKPFYYFFADTEQGDKIPIYVPVDNHNLVYADLTYPTKSGY